MLIESENCIKIINLCVELQYENLKYRLHHYLLLINKLSRVNMSTTATVIDTFILRYSIFSLYFDFSALFVKTTFKHVFQKGFYFENCIRKRYFSFFLAWRWQFKSHGFTLKAIYKKPATSLKLWNKMIYKVLITTNTSALTKEQACL